MARAWGFLTTCAHIYIGTPLSNVSQFDGRLLSNLTDTWQASGFTRSGARGASEKAMVWPALSLAEALHGTPSRSTHLALAARPAVLATPVA